MDLLQKWHSDLGCSKHTPCERCEIYSHYGWDFSQNPVVIDYGKLTGRKFRVYTFNSRNDAVNLVVVGQTMNSIFPDSPRVFDVFTCGQKTRVVMEELEETDYNSKTKLELSSIFQKLDENGIVPVRFSFVKRGNAIFPNPLDLVAVEKKIVGKTSSSAKEEIRLRKEGILTENSLLMTLQMLD